MLIDQESSPHLKPWLVRTLEPICDAEPGALADYVLALLKHDGPEGNLRKEMQSQLDEFLEKECLPFLDTLFTVLRTKSYLPYSTSSSSTSPSDTPASTGTSIPVDGSRGPPDRGLKRSLDNDERDGRPTKGPRLSAEGQISRYESGRSGGHEFRQNGNWGPWGGPQAPGYRDVAYMQAAMNGMMNGQRQQAYHPPDQKRGICRDYHHSGYCARGSFCKYSHGDDAVVPNQLWNGQNMPNGMPFMPMFPNPFVVGGAPAAYDPHEAKMDVRGGANGRHQQLRPALIPRLQQEDGSHVIPNLGVSGELPVIQDLTPTVPHNDVTPNLNPNSSQPPFLPQSQPVVTSDPPSGGDIMRTYPLPVDTDMSGPPPMAPRPPTYSGGHGRHTERIPGTFNGDAPNFRPERRKDKTLVMEKIPEDKLSLEHVNAWFKRFGTVTNVAIDRPSAKALISFSTHEEAHTAWKSEDAVFGNRFVKLFWHRPMEGHGTAGSRILAASAPILANLTTPPPSLTIPTPSPSVSSRPPAVAALAAKQRLLEQQIAEQKTLMASLDTASSAEKKTIMARLRKLGEEMKSTPPAPPKVNAATVEQKAIEVLDKELDMHAVGSSGDDQPESTEDLKAKLERLKAEAASLGITDAPIVESPSSRGGRGRGRGSGRGYFRGGPMRGGGPRVGSMKLDNRPKQLLVKGVPSDNMQVLQDWYETTGQVESLVANDNGDIIVSFKSRGAAEQGLAKGTNLPTIGSVQVVWHTGPPSSVTKSVSSTTQQTTVTKVSATTTPEIPRERTPEVQPSHMAEDEEIVASGWGGDVEDGMGL